MKSFMSNPHPSGVLRTITLYSITMEELDPEAQVAIDVQLADVDLTDYELRVYERYDGSIGNFWLENRFCKNEVNHSVDRCACYEWRRVDKQWVRYE